MSTITLPTGKRKLILFGIIGAALALLVAYFIYLQLEIVIYQMAGWVALVLALFFVGNTLITRALNRLLPWKSYHTYRFLIQLLLTIIYSLTIVNTSFYALRILLTQSPPDYDQFEQINVFGLVVLIPAVSIYFGIHFLRAWKKSELVSERLQKDQVKSQLDALKNHLDPHFLFNNLNILSALIDKDAESSKRFVEKFAEVYRFLLKNKATELVDLANELQFLDSYMYLIQCRFGKLVQLNNTLDCNMDACFVAPFTLQMLFENGIKHNAISAQVPLVFDLYNEKGYMIVKNNINHRFGEVKSHKSGLTNIKSRYAYFTDKPVLVENDGQHFVVKIPLIEIEEI